jgi:signal transduction histidine kinase
MSTNVWPTRLIRYAPWAVGAAVFLLSGIVEDTRLPPFLGWQASKLWLNLAAVALAALCGIAAAFAHRYTWPILVMAIAAWFLAGMWPAIAVASYCAGMRWPRPWRLTYLIAAILLTGCPIYYGGVRDWPALASVYYAIAIVAIVVVFPLLLGRLHASRSIQMEQLADRAAEAEKDQALREEQARSNERAAIAREMHDIVAHRVALIVLHAGAMELAARDPQTTKRAGLIRTLGKQAMSELRQMLGALRTEKAAALAPQPTIADLQSLIGQARDAGLPAALQLTGTPRELPAATELTAYRVVQEALTNVAKHAGTPPTTVNLDYGPHTLAITVDNDPPAGHPIGMPTGGLGLIGLSERLCLMDGTLHTGPRPDGGYRLQATLPIG